MPDTTGTTDRPAAAVNGSHGPGAATAEDEARCLDDVVLGPGWYDSSWDLHRGLVVREGVLQDPWLQLAFALHFGLGESAGFDQSLATRESFAHVEFPGVAEAARG